MCWSTSHISLAAKLLLTRQILGSRSVKRYLEFWHARRHKIWLSPPFCWLVMLSTGGWGCSNRCKSDRKRWTGHTSGRDFWRSFFQTLPNMCWIVTFSPYSRATCLCRPMWITLSTWGGSTRRRLRKSGAAENLRVTWSTSYSGSLYPYGLKSSLFWSSRPRMLRS